MSTDTETPWNGVPLNPEVDGWHWCRARADNVRANTHEPFPVYWTAPSGHISGGWVRCIYDAEYAAAHWTYLGPVRTEADLRAAYAAGFKAGVEAAAEWHEKSAGQIDAVFTPVTKRARAHRAFAASIRALPIPDASALDAARAQRVADLEAALHVALALLTPLEPGDSRAVSVEFVAIAAVSCGVTDEPTRTVLREASAAIRARTPTTGETTDAE